MTKKVVFLVSVIFTVSYAALAQNTNSSTPARPRSANTPSQQPTDTVKPSTTAPAARSTPPKPSITAAPAPGSTSVVEAFNRLIDGIRKADVKAVTGVYWNSPRLALFNNNGTVTKGWEQLRKNRESSYPDIKDVKLDVRDVAVTMLGRDGAVVTCIWTQSQTYKGTPEEASGRMTLVFKRVGREWKVIHLHTSPDKEDPSRVLPSERTSPVPSLTPTPTPVNQNKPQI
ncbi:MAG TPA: AtzH-like domain-containing protein [Pyrinomonadaceae bacterium]|nr:AtzH-like domain-containing protein [Pyrinomonadaceae bacterium]